MKKLLYILMFLCFVSCEYGNKNVFYKYNEVNKREQNFIDMGTPSLLNDNQSSYTVLLITDVHFGATAGQILSNEFFDWLEQKKLKNELPRFCLCLGDIADRGYKKEFDSYLEFQNKVEAYGIPVFNSVGNHDLYNSGWKNWKDAAAQGLICQENSFYKFNTQQLSWYTFDSGSNVIGNNQLKKLTKEILSDSNNKIIFTHYPAYHDTLFFGMEDTDERNELITLFNKNKVKVLLCGHDHVYAKEDCGKFVEYLIPSFRHNKQWGVLFVDEDKDEYSVKIIDAK